MKGYNINSTVNAQHWLTQHLLVFNTMQKYRFQFWDHFIRVRQPLLFTPAGLSHFSPTPSMQLPPWTNHSLSVSLSSSTLLWAPPQSETLSLSRVQRWVTGLCRGILQLSSTESELFALSLNWNSRFRAILDSFCYGSTGEAYCIFSNASFSSWHIFTAESTRHFLINSPSFLVFRW